MRILKQALKTTGWAVSSLAVGMIAGFTASLMWGAPDPTDDWVVQVEYEQPVKLQEDDLGWFCGVNGDGKCALDGGWARGR